MRYTEPRVAASMIGYRPSVRGLSATEVLALEFRGRPGPKVQDRGRLGWLMIDKPPE